MSRPRWIAAGLLALAGYVTTSGSAGIAGGLRAQVGGPGVRPTPVGPPAPQGRPLTRKELEQKHKGRYSSPSGSTPNGAQPGGAAAGGPAAVPVVKRAESRAAAELLRSLDRAAGLVRDETLKAELTILRADGRRDRLALQIWRKLAADGSQSLLIKHGRAADLPPGVALVEIDAKGNRRAFRYGPEDKRRVELEPGDGWRIEGTALRLDDFIPPDFDADSFRYEEGGILDGKVVTHYGRAAAGASPACRLSVRNDTKNVVRMAFGADADEPTHRQSFDEFRFFGVHRRWMEMRADDSGKAASVIVRSLEWAINGGVDGIDFSPAGMAKVL